MVDECDVTTEVANNGPSARSVIHPGSTRSKAWRDLGDGPDHRLELAGITVGVVIDQGDVWATSLSLAAALADDDTFGSRRRRYAPRHGSLP